MCPQIIHLRSAVRLTIASLTLSTLMLTDCEPSLLLIDLIDPMRTLTHVVCLMKMSA